MDEILVKDLEKYAQKANIKMAKLLGVLAKEERDGPYVLGPDGEMIPVMDNFEHTGLSVGQQVGVLTANLIKNMNVDYVNQQAGKIKHEYMEYAQRRTGESELMGLAEDAFLAGDGNETNN